MAVGISLALKVGLSAACLLLQASCALVIKQEPLLDTELYVAPATYTRKDGKALPSTIIISRPLGVRGDAFKDSMKEEFSQGSFTLVSNEKEVSQGDIDLDSNIKFYKIECTSGRPCTSIIPARPSPPPDPPEIPFTEQELKDYLAQFGLYDGFPYTDDYENSGSPERPKENEGTRYFNKHANHDRDSDRAFGSEYYDSNSYWPGSAYRPRPIKPSKAQVFKFQQQDLNSNNRPIPDFPTRRPVVDFPTRRPLPGFSGQSSGTRPQLWEEVKTLRPISNDRFSNPVRPHRPKPQQLPKPFQYDDDAILPPYGPPRPTSPPRTTSRPTSYDGIWNRYGVSTISQLDRDTGEWVKISSSSTQLDQGIFDFPEAVPSGTLPPATHHAKASLTVLGISDRQPHSTFTDGKGNKPHMVKIPSSHPGNPPELIETDGGRPRGI